MNVGNILKVADAIEQGSVPGLGFNMVTFVAHPDRDEGIEDNSGHSCGTVACIAGTCHVLRTNNYKPVRISLFDWVRQADWLGLNRNAGYELFFADSYAKTNDDFELEHVTPAQAACCLRNLAITGKVDWEAAMKSDEPVLPSLPVTAPKVTA